MNPRQLAVAYRKKPYDLEKKYGRDGVRLRKKICVGQGYRGLRMSDLGIGVCTRGFQRFVNGCPPKARDIFEFLQSSRA